MKINFDLENSPLQIKTNSEVGSNEKVRVTFRSSRDKFAGRVILYFSSPPKYELYYCNYNPINFPNDLPSETDKVWTITMSRVSGGIRQRVAIHCNDKEVVDVVLSSTTFRWDKWSTYWWSHVDKISFSSSYDTASDYYRPG